MNEFSAILLAGGNGTRMESDIPKQYLLLHGKPIIIHSLEKLDKIDYINEIIIASPHKYIEKTKEIISNYNLKKRIRVIEGGDTRQESVYLSLLESGCENILIHEAARPFVKKNEYINLIELNCDIATYAKSIPFTVLKGDKKINGLLNREELLNIQLPQKFKKTGLLKSHEKAIKNDKYFTEDISLYYYFNSNKNIKVLEGSEYNMKITTQLDLIVGETLYEEGLLE